MSTDQPRGWPRRRWAWWFASLAALLALPAAWAVLARRRDGSCRNLELVASYAGAPGTFQSLAGPTSHQACGLGNLDGLHARLLVSLAVTLVAATVIFLVCDKWWQHAWLTRRFVDAEGVKWLAPVAAGCDVIAKLIVAVAVHIGTDGADRPVELNHLAAFVVPGVVWVKVFSFAGAWLAAMMTLLAAFSRRRLRSPADPNAPAHAAEIAGLGICCSGGGIRSAGVSMGALGMLERTPAGERNLLNAATYIASVSGGGYTVGGWRAASHAKPPDDRQAWPSGVIGDPAGYDSPPPLDADSRVGPGPPSLYRHLQQRREFLRTGRGGLPASLLVVLAFLLFHLLLWTVLLVVIAWPLGRLTTTWFVVGAKSADPASFVDVAGRQLPVPARLYGPAVFFAVVAVLVFASCMIQWNTTARGKLMRVGKGLVAAAVALAVLLIGIPWLLDVVYPFITTNAAAKAVSSILSAGGVVAIVVGIAKRAVMPRLLYLGGVLLLIATVLLGVVIAGQAALAQGFFALDWVHGLRGTTTWTILFLLLVAGYFLLCPRWWSLHTVYRNRLRGAFITSRDKTTAPRALSRTHRTVVDDEGKVLRVESDTERMWPVRQSVEPLLSAYDGAPGPIHLVCCSMARSSSRATGVRALSFVVDATNVTYYDVDYRPGGIKCTAHTAPTGQWVQALGSRHAWQAEGTVSAAISVSGAAVAPAMGRLDKGTTNSLLALFNLRLGTWWPNPRYVPWTGEVKYPWVRLSSLLKEITGYFDPDDHHLYVTDGGHRENLGLVELLRRRCRTMICVDASGDTPGSFTTLRQAADLARLEVGAHIDLGSLPDRPAPGTVPPMPERAHHVLPVDYRDDDGESVGSGTVVYIGSTLFVDAPDDLIAFGLEDTRFPHYSTSDQFLTEEQFRRLVSFGKAATDSALHANDVREAIDAALGTDLAGDHSVDVDRLPVGVNDASDG